MAKRINVIQDTDVEMFEMRVNSYLARMRELLRHEKTVYAVTEQRVRPDDDAPHNVTIYTAVFEEWS